MCGGPAYRNPSLPVGQRVSDLLSRMTLHEKVAQMLCVWQGKAQTLLDSQGRFDPAEVTPLYPFGFGLSYTRFEFSPPRLQKQTIRGDQSVTLSVDVTNTGDRAGDEVVQMYIRDCVSSVTRPVKELKGFRRISLNSKETRTVTFEITPEHLAFYNIDMKFAVEPGKFEIMVGNSSQDNDLQKVLLEVTKT